LPVEDERRVDDDEELRPVELDDDDEEDEDDEDDEDEETGTGGEPCAMRYKVRACTLVSAKS